MSLKKLREKLGLTPSQFAELREAGVINYNPHQKIKCKMTIELIAKIAHEVNRAYCTSIGDASQSSWENAPEWQKTSAENGVRFHLANPHATPENSHESWLAEKEADGWKYGEVKDPSKKEHPCFRPYNELPQEQRTKDYLFKSVVDATREHIPATA